MYTVSFYDWTSPYKHDIAALLIQAKIDVIEFLASCKVHKIKTHCGLDYFTQPVLPIQSFQQEDFLFKTQLDNSGALFLASFVQR